MKQKRKAPAMLSNEEKQKLNRRFWMADWHFEETIKKQCTHISSHSIYWDDDKNNPGWIRAAVYGLRAIRTASNESCIANIFIRYENKVYQVHDVVAAAEIIKLLEKEFKFGEYMDKMADLRFKERKKKEQKKKEAKIKKMQVVKQEVA